MNGVMNLGLRSTKMLGYRCRHATAGDAGVHPEHGLAPDLAHAAGAAAGDSVAPGMLLLNMPVHARVPCTMAPRVSHR